MTPKDLDRLIEKYLAGNCTREECDVINAWYSALGKDPNRLAQRDIDQQIASAETRILKNLQLHADKVAGQSSGLPAQKQRSLFLTYTGIAASLLLCLSVGFYFLPDRLPSLLLAENVKSADTFTSIENTSAAQKRVILPDGSIVQMAPGSTIAFSNNRETPSRELILEGEAYFDVAHNSARPFFVYAGDVVTKVLGTSFIIRAVSADRKVTVTVKTGKVTVYTRNATHKKTVLVPNQEAVYDGMTDVVATQTAPASQSPLHKPDLAEMHFEETPIPEVLAALTKTYDIDIIFEQETLSECVLTSSFFEEGLYDRIDVICTAIGATYHVVDARIVIESKGCNLKPA